MDSETDVLIVGGGQAGLAMSEHLTERGISHVILERSRIAERWRSERWDSLVANGPAWHDRIPSMEFADVPSDEFATKDQIVEYLETYAKKIDAPIRTGIEVTSVTKNLGTQNFRIETSDGAMTARFIVAATGPFQKPQIPAMVPDDSPIEQIHSSAYRNPQQLADGSVLVVGSGSSGVQISEEIQRSGRQTYLAVGPHNRPPRKYRDRDIVWWLGVLGKWEASAPSPDTEHLTIAVSGANGGRTVDLRRLATEGVQLLGRAEYFNKGNIHFANDLVDNVKNGDANYLSLLNEADAYISRNGLNLPEEPEAHQLGTDPECLINPTHNIDITDANIKTIIWATGFRLNYDWLHVDTFQEGGLPRHHRGISAEPGLYFIGLPWLSRLASGFIWGCWHDAKFIADQIQIQNKYRAHQASRLSY